MGDTGFFPALQVLYSLASCVCAYRNRKCIPESRLRHSSAHDTVDKNDKDDYERQCLNRIEIENKELLATISFSSNTRRFDNPPKVCRHRHLGGPCEKHWLIF